MYDATYTTRIKTKNIAQEPANNNNNTAENLRGPIASIKSEAGFLFWESSAQNGSRIQYKYHFPLPRISARFNISVFLHFASYWSCSPIPVS